MDTEELLKERGWTTSDTYVGRKGSWFRTRHVLRVTDKGETETSTVLEQLARVKYSEGWAPHQRPYWKDKNWLNETVENIELMTEQGHEAEEASGRPSELGIPHPAGSKEYMAEYRRRNREKFRAANKKYQKAAREALAKERGRITTSPEATPVVDETTGQMSEQLASILEKLEAKP